MPVQGESRQYAEQPLFALEIQGIEFAYFESCSEFEEEAQIIAQREGGNKNVASKTDGVRDYKPLTLVRGFDPSNTDLSDWWDVVKEQGSRAAERTPCAIVQLDNSGAALGRINLERVWPSAYKVGPWKADANETVKEEITLQYHKGKRVPA